MIQRRVVLFDKAQQLAAQDSPSCEEFRMHINTQWQDEDGRIHDRLEDDYAEVDPEVLTEQIMFLVASDIDPDNVI
jgi:hypothetical protein